MKKTMQSLLTAAVFAAAITTGTGGTLHPQLVSAENADDITTVPQTSYGPPVFMMTTDEEDVPLIPQGDAVICPDDETTTTTEELSLAGDIMPYTTTEEQELELAGEPVIFSEKGDFNFDGSVDARDLTILKQFLLFQLDGVGFSSRTGDINGDGTMDKKDVKALIRMLTGNPEADDEEEQVTTALTMPPFPETSTDVTAPTYMVLYGPPSAWK